ncbi:MAG TPA: DUF3048 domain-containing protein [Propionicimonas sp.]|jgi:hypothetical protein|uniref:DUF3048 domain-containing protein n=1 Tax=Propionicimonas sp. TaxID=1955623 RepID=UPI002F40182E
MLNRRTALVTMLGAAGAATAGCGLISPDGAQANAGATELPTITPTAEPTPTPTVDTRPRAPLTGRLLNGSTVLDHAAVAIKVSDVASAHPQAGVNAADLVFVEPNGISYTRLCAVFHSRFPELVGPVRSIRPVDVPLLSPLKPVFGNTAAARWVMRYVEAHAATLENLYSFKLGVHGTQAYYTMPHRARVHSVFCRPDELRKLAVHMKAAPAEPYLPFAIGDEQVSTEISGKPASSVSVPWGPADTFNTGYDYDAGSGRYLRNEPNGAHVLLDGHRVTTDNVLVVRAKWKMDKIYAGGGAPDPVVDIIDGHGTFYYLHKGRYVKGTWTKAAITDLFQFTLDDGSPLKVAPGRTFMELPQINARVHITA